MSRTFFEWVVRIIDRYWFWFLQGAGVTLFIAVIGTLAGFAIGLMIGVVKTIPLDNVHKKFSIKRFFLRIFRAFLSVYIEVFRGTPMIVQAVVIYYGLSEAAGVNLHPLFAGIVIVSINTGAYMAEVVRGGIESIDKGQTEAAQAMGMTHFQTMRCVILPQAIRNILPATGNEFVINIKDTSVLNVISVTELFFQTKSVTGILLRTYETFLVTAVIYLVLTVSVTKLLKYLEKKMDGPKNFTLYTSSTYPGSILKANETVKSSD